VTPVDQEGPTSQ